MKLTKEPWGRHEGREIFLFELDNGRGCRVRVSNYGGVLQAFFVRDCRGVERDIVLGYDTLEEYRCSETFFGAMVGPVADRLAEGRCELDGREVHLPLNAGPDCMHSGPAGFHAHVWDWAALEDGIAFCRKFRAGETGFPGEMKVRFAYRLTGPATLRIEYAAESSCEMVFSCTNHSYFNLNGRGHCRDCLLTVAARDYAETLRERDPICSGRCLSAAGTPFDLRSGARIGDVLMREDFREIRTGGGIDHYFPVPGEGMRLHVQLACPESGLKLHCRSDAPGVLVYTGNGLDGERGKGGAAYEKNGGVCLETECFPNAVNFPEHRRQVLHAPGERYTSATEFEVLYT